ncbi:MAG TPA: translation initiation factor IF-2 [Alphaproteobacteria bacterium]|nr:translation initiation factor IF-2 [Alphaproteobacteria bacterium]
MSDNNENKGKITLSLGKKIEATTVKQNFSRMRTKNVTVEVKKSKFAVRKPEDELNAEELGLSQQELESRLEILKKAKENKPLQNNVVYKKSIEVEDFSSANTDNNQAGDELDDLNPEAQTPKIETPKSYNSGVFIGKRSIEVINNKPAAPAPVTSEYEPKNLRNKEKVESRTSKIDDEIEADNKRKGVTKFKGDDNRWNKKLTISQALTGDGDERVRNISAFKRRKKAKQSLISSADQGFKEKTIIIPEIISVQELANRMSVRAADVVKELMKLGIIKRAVEEIDADTAEILVTEFKHIPKRVSESDIEAVLHEEEVSEDDLLSRPPVITVMGHVDHGKTSLLDSLRNANIVSGEAGGITQHIGAYQITTQKGQKVTFIDTPGHAAFTAMRARGADATDIVILVVAADDGVMPQTVEAINHAKAAEVPIIVAINKIDKPEANPTRVKQELLKYDIVAEEYGGDIQMVEISAKQKINLDGLLEAVLLQSEILDLKASVKQKPRGVVIESKVDKGKGVVATVLVQKGTLKLGDLIVAGMAFGRVKSIIDDKGKNLTEALPAQPVEVLGFDEVPVAGEDFSKVESDKQARDVVEYRKKIQLVEKSKSNAKGSLESLFQQAQSGGKELNVIVRGDVHGSVEAIVGSIGKIESDEVKLKIIHSAAGAISEGDVQLAISTKSIILGFNVRAEANAKNLAERENVDIRYYNIIYNLLDDIKLIVSGMLSPVIREVYLGSAEMLQIFKMSKYGKVAGCMVREGQVKRGAGVRLIRDNVVIHEGKLKTLKRFKDEVTEVQKGFECGMAFENYDDIREGDMVEAFETVSEARKLEG